MPLALQETDQGRRGSDWGLSQMEWLGVKFEWDPKPEHVLRQDSEFQPDWQLQRSIINVLNMPWKEIINSKSLDRACIFLNCKDHHFSTGLLRRPSFRPSGTGTCSDMCHYPRTDVTQFGEYS